MTASKSASLRLEAAKQTKNYRFGFLGTRQPCFRVPVTGSQEQRENVSQTVGCGSQRRQPALPARLWAAPGEGKAARSAPATSHLVNAINNVSSALRTSFSQAGGEFAKLQLGTGPEPPRTSVDALAAAPKHRGGVTGTQAQHPSVLWLPRGYRQGDDHGHGMEPAITPGTARPAGTRRLGAPFTLIPSASCSEAQEKFMMDTAPA